MHIYGASNGNVKNDMRENNMLLCSLTKLVQSSQTVLNANILETAKIFAKRLQKNTNMSHKNKGQNIFAREQK